MLRDLVEMVADQGREIAFWLRGERVVRRWGTRPPLFELWARWREWWEEFVPWFWIGVIVAFAGSVLLAPILLVGVLLRILIWGL